MPHQPNAHVGGWRMHLVQPKGKNYFMGRFARGIGAALLQLPARRKVATINDAKVTTVDDQKTELTVALTHDTKITKRRGSLWYLSLVVSQAPSSRYYES